MNNCYVEMENYMLHIMYMTDYSHLACDAV
jgi:hypothetical protein